MATTETADYMTSQFPQPMQLETQHDSQPDASQQTVALEGQPPAPASLFEALEIRLKDNPYDSNTWQDLINLAEDSGDFERITSAYEALLKVYPNLVSLVVLLSPTCTIFCEYCFPLCIPTAS
jgi:cleavage stimulation factor subunit 3